MFDRFEYNMNTQIGRAWDSNTLQEVQMPFESWMPFFAKQVEKGDTYKIDGTPSLPNSKPDNKAARCMSLKLFLAGIANPYVTADRASFCAIVGEFRDEAIALKEQGIPISAEERQELKSLRKVMLASIRAAEQNGRLGEKPGQVSIQGETKPIRAGGRGRGRKHQSKKACDIVSRGTRKEKGVVQFGTTINGDDRKLFLTLAAASRSKDARMAKVRKMLGLG
jgi:hypothetical protein